MRIQGFSKDRAREALDTWRRDGELVELNEEYTLIRATIKDLYSSAKIESAKYDRKDYIVDVLVGIGLYKYLSDQAWFNLRIAANDDFWRYIAACVIPDIVAERWGVNNDNYFWKQSNRLWPKTIWWYIHLTFHDSIENTQQILLLKRYNSDTIQGIVERTGKKGTFVDVYREIVFQYSLINEQLILLFKKKHAHGSDNLFRAILRLNTAKSLVTDPCLVKNGIKGYVESIINEITNNL